MSNQNPNPAPNPLTIDVIIPCHNAAHTLARAVDSVLYQENLGKIYLIDDGSSDATWKVITEYKAAYPTKIRAERFTDNQGVAVARNFGAVLAKSDHIAFLDADDAYQSQALQGCAMVFERFDVGLIRLPMTPIDLPTHYQTHPDFAVAWRAFEMTAGSNMVFYRPYFLALGGFDDDEIFKKFGGEDGALSLATIDTACVATLFDNDGFNVGVDYHCHDHMHAKHLFDAMLFGQNARQVGQADLDRANSSTQNAVDRANKLARILSANKGRLPIKLS
ncbi:MAG: glycosyltransferase family 2 protein [Moraxella sp.]|nr:glycosyltransferase family 2 protein [Moraxella sp.]